jgi:hypothetical protein
VTRGRLEKLDRLVQRVLRGQLVTRGLPVILAQQVTRAPVGTQALLVIRALPVILAQQVTRAPLGTQALLELQGPLVRAGLKALLVRAELKALPARLALPVKGLHSEVLGRMVYHMFHMMSLHTMVSLI